MQNTRLAAGAKQPVEFDDIVDALRSLESDPGIMRAPMAACLLPRDSGEAQC
jgi:hypothetical protein